MVVTNIFLRFFENSSDELGTGNTRHLRKSIVNNLLFLLRYTVIIYKFTQGNLGAKKIASSRFQSPVKKINRKLRHWRPTARSLNTICGMVVGFTTTYAISTYHHYRCEFESRSGEVYSIHLRQVGGFFPGTPVSATI